MSDFVLTQEDKLVLGKMDTEQRIAALAHPDSLNLCVDYWDSGQVPAGITYKSNEVYVNGQMVASYKDGELELKEDDFSLAELQQIFSSVKEIAIWGNDEPLIVMADGVTLLDRQLINPVIFE